MRAKKLFEATDDLSRSKAYVSACIIMQSKVPVHYSVMIATEVIFTDRIRTAATDGAYIYVNPAFFRGLPSDSQRAFLLAHEAAHIMLAHPQRGKRYRERGYFAPGIRFDHSLYNWCADAVINNDLIAAGLEFIEAGIHEPHKYTRNDVVDAVYAAEYRDAAQKEENKPEQSDESGEPSDADSSDEEQVSGSGSEQGSGDEQGDEPGDEEGDESEPQSTGGDGHDEHFEPVYENEADAEADAEDIRSAVDNGIEASIAQGIKPTRQHRAAGNLSRTDAQASGRDWRGELADRLVRCGNDGEVRPSRIHRRRYATLGIITPARQGVIGRLVIEIDISSSVDRNALSKFIVETAALVDALNPREGVTVLFVNTVVSEVHEVMTGSELLDIKVPMGGGTLLSAGPEWMEAQGLEWDLFLCFTDGYLNTLDWQILSKVEKFVMVLDRDPVGHAAEQVNNIDHIIVTP